MKILGVILARGGSKTIPFKNIAEIGLKPLIYWSIKAGMDSGMLDWFVVSTDHTAIADVARRWMIDDVIWRPERLSGDRVSSFDALLWTVKEVEKFHSPYDIIVELPTTNPLKTGEDVRGAIELLKSCDDIDSVASVSRVINHPSRTKKIIYDGKFHSWEPVMIPYCDECGEHDNRKQDLVPAYERNGAVYVMRRETLFEKKDRFGDICVPFIMPKERGINIDTPFDLKVAELLLKDR